MIKILIVSGGSLVAQNLLEVLQERRSGLELIVTNSHLNESTLSQFDRVYLTPNTMTSPEAFEDRLLAILEMEAPDLVVPARDDDVFFLADLADRYPEWAPFMVSRGREAARIILDKWLSYLFCQKNNLPFVPSLVSSDHGELIAFAAEYGFPLLAKPRAGFYAIYEFNGRFTGATAARAYLGYDEIKLAIEGLTNFSIPPFDYDQTVSSVDKKFYNSPTLASVGAAIPHKQNHHAKAGNRQPDHLNKENR